VQSVCVVSQNLEEGQMMCEHNVGEEIRQLIRVDGGLVSIWWNDMQHYYIVEFVRNGGARRHVGDTIEEALSKIVDER
jgi:hypothetical protein